jgi:hypothetical protein
LPRLSITLGLAGRRAGEQHQRQIVIGQHSGRRRLPRIAQQTRRIIKPRADAWTLHKNPLQRRVANPQIGRQPVGERALDHQHLNLAGRQQIFDLVAAVMHVHRHHHRAQQESRIFQQDELGRGLQHQPDLLAAPNPGGRQTGSTRPHVPQQIRIGPVPILEDQRDLVGL